VGGLRVRSVSWGAPVVDVLGERDVVPVAGEVEERDPAGLGLVVLLRDATGEMSIDTLVVDSWRESLSRN